MMAETSTIDAPRGQGASDTSMQDFGQEVFGSF